MPNSKKRIKITLDKYVSNLITEMSEEKNQSKSVVISNLVLDHEKLKKHLFPTLTDKQFHEMSSTLQEINNQLRTIRMEISMHESMISDALSMKIIDKNDLPAFNNDFYKDQLVEFEKEVNKLDKELTEIVNNQC